VGEVRRQPSRRDAGNGLRRHFSTPDHVGLDGWFLLCHAPGGLNASMRPSHDPAIAKAGLAFRSELLTYDRGDLDQQRQLLVDRFAGAGWHCDELLTAAQQADEFYYHSFAQVQMDSWSSGRVTLCGDAGYCASPLRGMGTSLAFPLQCRRYIAVTALNNLAYTALSSGSVT
jgi:2-polyprenyl-6-methoxyphenol hydroxylase-like FAD-dependent oxidoreductase